MKPAAVPRYIRTSEVVEADMTPVPVLLNKANWEYVEFNKVGGAIWALLAEPKSVDELCDALVERFDVDHARCEAEVREFLKNMEDAGLLVPAG